MPNDVANVANVANITYSFTEVVYVSIIRNISIALSLLLHKQQMNCWSIKSSESNMFCRVAEFSFIWIVFCYKGFHKVSRFSNIQSKQIIITFIKQSNCICVCICICMIWSQSLSIRSSELEISHKVWAQCTHRRRARGFRFTSLRKIIDVIALRAFHSTAQEYLQQWHPHPTNSVVRNVSLCVCVCLCESVLCGKL